MKWLFITKSANFGSNSNSKPSDGAPFMQIWKDPNLIMLYAKRKSTAVGSLICTPFSNGSLSAKSSVYTMLAALVVGIPKWCIASLHKNSLIFDLKTAFPSSNLE